MMNKLGIYFGKDKISIVEVQGRHVTKQASAPFLDSGLTEGLGIERAAGVAPGGANQVEVIKSVLTNSGIEAKSGFIGLASKDLFIRGFQMLSLNKAEIDSGVRFEAKKYLPALKTEDLIFDYKYRTDKKLGKMDVLFAAASQNIIDKYFEIFSQLGIQAKGIEPASFALIRILSLTKQYDPKLSFAFVAIQDLDVQFSIMSEGFLCFSRDIKLPQAPTALSVAASEGGPTFQQRIASEIRVSLDYFRRQFSGRSVDKVFFIAKNIKEDSLSDLDKALGLDVQLVDLSTDKELSSLADLDSLKAYSLAIRDTVKMNLSVDLTKKKFVQLSTDGAKAAVEGPFVFNINMIKQPLIIAAVLLVLSYTFPMFELMQVAKQLVSVKGEVVTTLGPNLSFLPLDLLQQKKTESEEKLQFAKDLLNFRLYYTPLYNVLPKVVKSGLWINELNILTKDKSKSLSLKGAVYLGDANAEAKAAEDFLNDLKASPDFMSGLTNLDLVSINQTQGGDQMITIFEISGS